MGKIIAIANQKGGVGKTTTAINLATSLSLEKKNILIVDTDPQGNLTSGLGFNRDELSKTIYDIYTGKTTIKDVIIPTLVEGLYLIPSNINLLAVEIELVQKQRREFVLSDALSKIRDLYNYIFIDCPPSLGLLTLNGLVSADSVIIPSQCEYYSLEGLGLLSRTIKLVKESFNPSLEIEGIVLTMFDSRNTLTHQVAEEIKKFFGDKVYQTLIPRNVSLAEAPSHGKPALYYDNNSKGAQGYLSLAMEILYENSIR